MRFAHGATSITNQNQDFNKVLVSLVSCELSSHFDRTLSLTKSKVRLAHDVYVMNLKPTQTLNDVSHYGTAIVNICKVKQKSLAA